MVNSGKDKRVRNVRGAYPHDKDDALEQTAKDRDLIAKYTGRFGVDSLNAKEIEVIKEVEKIVEVENPETKEQLDNFIKENANLNKQKDTINADLTKHIEEVSSLNEIIKELELQHNGLTDEVLDYQKQIAKLNTDNEKLLEMNKNQSDDLKKLRKELPKLKQALAALSTDAES